ncbi:tRNA dimethylallyltransferase [Pneumocystis murina B123]|uniref:tRNA dimethylallyltransferase n=1 Tax=Pneumocystis murina (strain B123) TaxID=1069680 RepID=M7P9B6_PNEMU|nr:tRNA dimethylallyltransferase [Pneumocystis murina B123]EMR10450.1 tRNA dimethylallyltransferase [Pneumocystis murina B123]
MQTSLRNICVIIGATGSGKSKLGVALAKAFSGEIINGDAMQIYEGLDVLTNKQPLEERQGVKHHLLGYLNITDAYNVFQYEKEALYIIERLHEKKTLPVFIGGTHYYIQSVLFKNALLSKKKEVGETEEKILDKEEEKKEYMSSHLLNMSTVDLYSHLKEIDPLIAKRWHPNDRRKIQRSLEIYYETGTRPSDLYNEQRQHSDKREVPRFRTCIFWVYCDYKVLDEILDKRVDKMCDSGLFDEINMMYDVWNTLDKQKIDLDVQKGIWQAIGFKEFLPYLQLPKNSKEQTRNRYLLNAIASMKLATRQYARKQVKWIKNKLYPLCKAAGMNIRFYLLDATNLSLWDTQIQNLAISLFSDFLQDKPGPDPLSLNTVAATLLSSEKIHDYASQTYLWKHYTCNVCKTSSGAPLVAVGLPQWTIHVQGRRHKRIAAKLKTKINSLTMENT